MNDDILEAALSMTPDDLIHHGIKGQKWGVRRFQDKSGKRTAAGKVRAKYTRERKLSDEEKLKSKGWKTGSQYLVGESDRQIHEWEYSRFSGQLKSPAKTLSEYVDVGDTSGQTPKGLISTGWDLSGGFKSFEDMDISSVNPEFGSAGTVQNCAKCTVAVELGRYGVKVPAGRQTFPSSADAMSYWFDGATKTVGSMDDLESTLVSQGEGSSGCLAGFFAGGGGHAMHYSVSNGQVHIQDGQNGRKFGSIKEVANEYGFDTNTGFESYRLDNATPNWDHLAEDSVISTPNSFSRVWTTGNTGDRIFTSY